MVGVTIAIAVRDKLGLRLGDEIDFVVDGDSVRIVRSTAPVPQMPSRE